MSEYKLSSTAQVSVKAAKDIIDMFFSKVPKVKAFLNMLGDLGKRNGYIRTDPYFRRIRWFPEKDEKDFKVMGSIERASKNTIPQGINASITKYALVLLQNKIDYNRYPVRILLTIHDSIVTESRKDFSERWKVILNDTMVEAAQILIKTVPIKVDYYISDRWKK